MCVFFQNANEDESQKRSTDPRVAEKEQSDAEANGRDSKDKEAGSVSRIIHFGSKER
jgi:hypothetical protein